MSGEIIATRGLFIRLSVLAKLCQSPGRRFARLFGGRAVVTTDDLDAWIRKDIGIGVAPPRDHRAACYRKMLEPGQPLL